MSKSITDMLRFLIRYWNALLAGTSLLGVAIFALMPPLQQYVKVFVFLAANAIVWTLIEIKTDLRVRPEEKLAPFPNMRIARANIVRAIEQHLDGTAIDAPLQVSFIGGRLRSMSDIAREVVDDLRSDRKRGHVEISIYCIAPSYIAARCLPGHLDPSDQLARNAGYGRTVQSIATELGRVTGPLSKYSSANIKVTHYSEDPHFYAYIIGNDLLFWGPYTYSDTSSDFIGPENACFEVNASSPEFQVIRSWLSSRMLLYSTDTISNATRNGTQSWIYEGTSVNPDD